jgi:hypothetical protein
MGLGRNRIMSDARKPEPDEDLLEFLGGIDEVNEDSKDGEFADFLADSDIEKIAEKPRSPSSPAPAKEGNRE